MAPAFVSCRLTTSQHTISSYTPYFFSFCWKVGWPLWVVGLWHKYFPGNGLFVWMNAFFPSPLPETNDLPIFWFSEEFLVAQYFFWTMILQREEKLLHCIATDDIGLSVSPLKQTKERLAFNSGLGRRREENLAWGLFESENTWEAASDQRLFSTGFHNNNDYTSTQDKTRRDLLKPPTPLTKSLSWRFELLREGRGKERGNK